MGGFVRTPDPIAELAIRLASTLDVELLKQAGLTPFAGSILEGVLGKLTEEQQYAVITVFNGVNIRKVIPMLEAWIGASFPENFFRPFRWVRIRPESPRETHAINIKGTFHSFNAGTWYSFDQPSVFVVDALRIERDERGNPIFEITDLDPVS